MPPPSEAHAYGPIAILGLGAVGRALAVALAESGAELILWSHRKGVAEVLADDLGPGIRALDELADVAAEARGLVLAASEVRLASLAEELGQSAGDLDPRVALHTNGLLGREPLAPLVGLEWPCGRMHPLVALPPVSDLPEPGIFGGVGFAVGGDPEAFFLADQIAAAVGAHSFELNDGKTALYHAAASLLASGVVGLFEMASAALEDALGDPEEATSLLLPLLASVEANLVAFGAEGALTGAAARGASELVGLHLETLSEKDPRLAEVYGLFAEQAVRLAFARGSIDEAARDRVTDELR